MLTASVVSIFLSLQGAACFTLKTRAVDFFNPVADGGSFLDNGMP